MSGFRLAIRGRPCRPQPHAEDSEERGIENAIPVTSPTPPRPRPGSWRPALPPRAGRIFLRIDQPNKFRMSAPLGHACGSQDATRDGLTKSSDEADRKSRTCVNASRSLKTVRCFFAERSLAFEPALGQRRGVISFERIRRRPAIAIARPDGNCAGYSPA